MKTTVAHCRGRPVPSFFENVEMNVADVYAAPQSPYTATLLAVGKREVQVRIDAAQALDNESPLAITLLQGIARGEKMDLILQKATELGVTAIVPVAISFVQRGFMLAMMLAAPFILGGFLFQLLSGMISKVMPALPVVFIAAPGAILLALLALVILVPSIISIWAEAVMGIMQTDLP